MSDSDVMGNAENTNPEQVMESLGEPAESAQDINNPTTLEGTSNSTNSEIDPLYVQKRLKQQSRQHAREMRAMQDQMAMLQSQLGNLNPQNSGMDMNANTASNADDAIQKAVHLALQQREIAERKQKEAESQAHLQKHYKDLQKHLDDMGEKYEDYHETVFSNDTPFTSTMRDYAVTLPRKGSGSAGEVLYHLAKNPDELKRISKLHPLDQAAEMTKLSHALISGGENKASPSRPAPLGNIKSTPISNSSITDKTPPSTIRARMKAGTWK